MTSDGDAERFPTGVADRRTALKIGGVIAALAVAGRSACAVAAAQTPMMRGVNLAGAEFGTAMPGRYNKDYVYPDAMHFQRFKALGFDCIRLPFRWERLQPDLGGRFDELEWSRLSAAIRAAAHNKQTLVLDPHNSARRKIRDDGFSKEHMVGSAQVPVETLVAFWEELAGRTRSEAHVVHGVMNEPADISAVTWLPIANRVIAVIRKAGAKQLILAPGVDWSGAHSWFGSSNTLMENLVDPGRHMAIEVHQYLDGNSSGQKGSAVSPTIGSERLEAFQEWARARGIKAFLGEFGGGNNAASLAAIEDMLIEVESNPDVWIGWTAWAAGPWWPPNEPFRLEPDAKGIWPAQTRVMAAFSSADGHVPDGRIEGAAIDLDFARGRAHGADKFSDAMACVRSSPALGLQRDGVLQGFAANMPRLTDLGLTIEGQATNTLVAVPEISGRPLAADAETGPVRGLRVWRLPAGTVPAIWARNGVPLRAAPGSPFATFSLFVRVDPISGGTLAVEAGGARAEFDFGKAQSRAFTNGTYASISGSGTWRRIAMTLPEGAARSARPSMILRATAGSSVLVAGAMLDGSAAATAYAQDTRAADNISLSGALLQRLLAEDAFTVLIETRGLAVAPVALPLLSAGGIALLGRRDDGGIECAGIKGVATRPIVLDHWRMRRRCVVSVARGEGRVTLATTGEAPRLVAARWPDLALASLRLGGIEGSLAALDGVVSRFAVIPRAVSPEFAAGLTG